MYLPQLTDLFEYIPGDDQGEVEHFFLPSPNGEIVIYPKSISNDYAVMLCNADGIYEQQGQGHTTLTGAMLSAVEYAGQH